MVAAKAMLGVLVAEAGGAIAAVLSDAQFHELMVTVTSVTAAGFAYLARRDTRATRKVAGLNRKELQEVRKFLKLNRRSGDATDGTLGTGRQTIQAPGSQREGDL